MINVSKEFLELMQTRTDFKQYADITFVDGTTLTLEAKDFTIGNNSVNEASDSDSLPLGASISRKIKICLMNNTDQYSTYDFVGAKIRLYLKYELSTTTETINFGTFTVTDPETYGVTITITAYDDMYKTDKPYTTGLSFPQTAGAMLRDICTTYGISLYSATFKNNNYVINAKPDGNYTARQVIGWISMIAGGNARINRSGSLEIISYDFSKVSNIVDGGKFAPWTQGDVFDGGTFNPWTTGDVLDGGVFGDRNDIHVLHAFKNLTVDTDDIVITGVSIKEDEETILYGEEGYLINVENPLVTDKRYFVQLLGDVLIGARFRKFSGDYIAYPLAEAMDLAIVLDRKGNAYSTIITDVNFVFFGFTTLKNSAASAIRNSSKYNSQSVQTYVKNKNLIEKQKTEFEKSIESLNFLIENSPGAYMTKVKTESGGTITYLHNHPTIEESDMIWEMTAEGWRVSDNGGETWNAGMTVDGVVIARILNTIGINADWINTGALTVKDSNGNLIFEVDKDTNSVFINAQYVTIGSKNVLQAITDVDTKADNAQSTADSASTAASNAQSTANTANTNAQNAQTSADKAQSTADSAQSTANSALSQSNTTSASLEALQTQEAIFNLMTNNGALQGLYMENGRIYINASYIKSGTIAADLIKSGTLQIGRLPGSNIYASYVGGLEFYDAVGKLTSEYNAVSGWKWYDTSNTAETHYFTLSGKEMRFYRSYTDSSGTDVSYYLEHGLTFDWENDSINASFGKLSANTTTLGDTTLGSCTIKNLTYTTSDLTATFDSNGKIYKKSSSSERYKDIDRILTDEDIQNVYNIEVYSAKYKDGYLVESDERYSQYMPMFIVENMEKYLPIAVSHNSDGLPEMWSSQIMIPVMFQMLKSQKNMIDTLTERLNKLENLLSMKGVI